MRSINLEYHAINSSRSVEFVWISSPLDTFCVCGSILVSVNNGVCMLSGDITNNCILIPIFSLCLHTHCNTILLTKWSHCWLIGGFSCVTMWSVRSVFIDITSVWFDGDRVSHGIAMFYVHLCGIPSSFQDFISTERERYLPAWLLRDSDQCAVWCRTIACSCTNTIRINRRELLVLHYTVSLAANVLMKSALAKVCQTYSTVT